MRPYSCHEHVFTLTVSDDREKWNNDSTTGLCLKCESVSTVKHLNRKAQSLLLWFTAAGDVRLNIKWAWRFLCRVALHILFVIDAATVFLDAVELKYPGAFDQGQVLVGLVCVDATDVAPHLVQARRVTEEPEHLEPGMVEARSPAKPTHGWAQFCESGGRRLVGQIHVLVSFTEEHLRRRERLYPCGDRHIQLLLTDL